MSTKTCKSNENSKSKFLTEYCVFITYGSWIMKVKSVKIKNVFYKTVHTTSLAARHFYFLLPINRESIVLGSNFRNGDFDGFTRFEVS